MLTDRAPANGLEFHKPSVQLVVEPGRRHADGDAGIALAAPRRTGVRDRSEDLRHHALTFAPTLFLKRGVTRQDGERHAARCSGAAHAPFGARGAGHAGSTVEQLVQRIPKLALAHRPSRTCKQRRSHQCMVSRTKCRAVLVRHQTFKQLTSVSACTLLKPRKTGALNPIQRCICHGCTPPLAPRALLRGARSHIDAHQYVLYRQMSI